MGRGILKPARGFPILLVAIIVLLFGAPPLGADSSGVSLPTILAEIDTALSYIKLTSDDLSLRTDYTDRDPFRLAIVDQVMIKPTDMAYLLDSAAIRIFGSQEGEAGGGVSGGVDVISLAFGGNPQAFMDCSYPIFLTKAQCAAAVLALVGDVDPKLRDWLLRFPKGCQLLYYELENCAEGFSLLDPLVAGWEPDEIEFLVDTLPQLLIEDPDAEFYPPEKIDSLQKISEAISERFLALAHQVNWQGQIGRALMYGREQLLFTSMPLPPAHPFGDTTNLITNQIDSTAFDGKIEFEIEAGRIALGGMGNDHYVGNYFFIFDPAGDDYYDLTPLSAGDNQFIYDISGNDIYSAPDGFALGCGFFGLGFLYDRAGDDTYRAGNFSLGAGFFGAGMLVDLGGDDVYISDTFTQGAGAFGFGFLYDHEGSDRYNSALYAQGFGFAAGVGLLADRTDNDTYFAGGKYKDILRYEDHYISLSQGFSLGIRPDFSGGVGWLLDGGGNDVYTCDIFGQGCAYWWAFGGLYDRGGNDSYNCFQYGQGSATHMAAGILFDKAGGDVYFGKGLMQGCGHDRSTGLMLDLEGDDTYTSWDLSQGAGSANGTGMLIDGGGEDRYYVKNPANTQAYGNPRRDFGSIGLFLDLGGADRYDGNGRDDDVWIINSKWGIGVDKNSFPEDEED